MGGVARPQRPQRCLVTLDRAADGELLVIHCSSTSSRRLTGGLPYGVQRYRAANPAAPVTSETLARRPQRAHVEAPQAFAPQEHSVRRAVVQNSFAARLASPSPCRPDAFFRTLPKELTRCCHCCSRLLSSLVAEARDYQLR